MINAETGQVAIRQFSMSGNATYRALERNRDEFEPLVRSPSGSPTAEIYTHVVPASQRAAIEKLEKAIWPQLDPNGPKLEGVVVRGTSLIQ